MQGTWEVQGYTGSFRMSRMNKEWIGFYMQDGNQTEMRFDHLNINFGVITGKGCDAVGDFTIYGQHNPQNNQIKIEKQYTGKHRVFYEGQFDGFRVISGRWSMPEYNISDTFRLEKNYDPNYDN